MSDLEANKAAVTAFFDCFSRSDWDGVRALCAPDFRWVVPTIGRMQSRTIGQLHNLVGPSDRSLEETMEGFRMSHDNSADGAFVTRVTTLTAEGDRVAAEGESRAVNKANGRLYTNRYMFHMFFRDGKIAQLREYQDTLHVMDVWGAE
jgi:ketosteroid isomerase-like protein